MSRRSSPRSLLQCGVAFVFAVTSCGGNDEVGALEGGQTGSAGCDPAPRCICDAVGGAAIGRGVFHEADELEAGELEAVVEVLEAFGPQGALVVGETVSGAYQVGFPCGLGSVEPVVAGQEVLVAYHPPTSSGGMSKMYVVGWNETLRLTPRLELPSSDAAVLVDPAECAERFPDEEPPCDSNF